MDINSKPDDRDVALMAIKDLAGLSGLDSERFVVIIEESGLAVYYSNEEEDSIDLLEQALKMQKKII